MCFFLYIIKDARNMFCIQKHEYDRGKDKIKHAFNMRVMSIACHNTDIIEFFLINDAL